MLIDWFTVAAQIINFLILVFLLKRFLYGRIIKAMDKREEKIASRIKEAESKHREAEKELEEYRSKSQEMDKKKEELLSRARNQAESRKEELLQEARQELNRQRQKWQDSIQKEKEYFIRDMKQQTADQFFSLSRRALKDLAGAELEKQMVETFLQRITEIGEDKKRDMAGLLGEGNAEAVVVTSSPLAEGAVDRITKALHEVLNSDAEIQFQTSAEILSGIELRINGYKVAWNLDHYLEAMEAEMQAAIAEQLPDQGN